jgi:hypothetical protein
MTKTMPKKQIKKQVRLNKLKMREILLEFYSVYKLSFRLIRKIILKYLANNFKSIKYKICLHLLLF